MSGLDERALARLFRSSCSVCGSARLVWGSVDDEANRLAGSGQTADGWLSDVAAGLGMRVGPELRRLDAWRCEDCGEVGVFGPSEVGP